MTVTANLVGELMARTGWSPDQLAAHQRQRLDALLRHAVGVSPYYRRVLGPDAVGAPLAELPTLSKAALMGHFDEIVADAALRRSDLAAHLAGPHAAEPYRGYLVLSTSGSTGAPAIFVYTPEQMAVGVAGLQRAMALFGVTPSTRLIGIGAPSAIHISRHLVAGLSAGRPAAGPRLSVTTPLPELVAALNTFQPEAFPTNASIAALLAEEQLAGRLRIAPWMVACTSEVLTTDMTDRIRAAWNIEPHQLYATTEGAVLASTGPARAGLHLWEDLMLVEVLDADGRPAAPGTVGQRVLLTNLVGRVQPLIRYELSDTLVLAGGADPGRWPFRRIASIEGRTDDILTLAAPGGATVRVHPLHLRAPFAGFPEVIRYQIVHDPDTLWVRIVTRPDATSDTPHRVEAALTRALAAAGAAPPAITVTTVPAIAPDPGGKLAVVRARRPGEAI